MKKFLCILGILTVLSAVCSFAAEKLPGNSIADSRLQYDTLMAVYSTAGVLLHKKCKDFKVVSTVLMTAPEDFELKKQEDKVLVSSPWEELWHVNYCKANIYVPITFIPKESGGTMYMLEMKNVHVEK